MSDLINEQIEILKHTRDRAAQGHYCCGPSDRENMTILVKFGLMEFIGRKSFVPDDYFQLTGKGRETLKRLDKRNTMTTPRPAYFGR